MKTEAYKAGWRAAEIGYLEDLSEIVGLGGDDAIEFSKGYRDQKNFEIAQGLLFALLLLVFVFALSVFVIK